MTLDELLHALPKAELHVHLDGSLRPGTMLELGREVGAQLPADSPDGLAKVMVADDAADLEGYLKRFAWTLSVMQTAEAIERIAYELVLDHAAENVQLLEVRWAPILNTEGELDSAQALEAGLRGLQRGAEETGVRVGAIVCALRHLDPAVSCELAELAVTYRDRGVVAFDLAAGEAGNPAATHAEAFTIAARGDLSRTVHAGEAWGADSIRQALVEGRALRIGHGTRLQEDPQLEQYLRDHRVCLEVCLTSNVQTRVAPTLQDHPLPRYFDLGIPVSLATDNRMVSGTTLTREYLSAATGLGFGIPELGRIARYGFEHAFLPWDDKRALLARVDREMNELGVVPANPLS